MIPLSNFGHAMSTWYFKPMPASRLAAVRIVVGLFTLWYCGRRVELYHDVARSEEALFAPIGVIRWLNQPLPPELYDSLVVVLLALAAAFTMGIFYRFTGPALAFVSLVVITYRNSWSMVYHTDNVLWLHLIILSITPAADRWSVDAWLKGRRSKNTQNAPGDSGNYGWPLRLMALTTAATYFLAGVAKVAGEEGWRWALGESLRRQVAVDGLRKDLFGSQAPEMAFWLYDNVWLFTLMGVGTFVLELGAPLFVLNRTWGKLWAIQAWGLHVGIWFVMGIRFEYCLTACIFAFLFDLEKPVQAMLRQGKRLANLFTGVRPRPARAKLE